MEIARVMKQMIEYSQGNLHDIDHLLKVYACAKMIGECEGLERETQTALELAAIVHDIACPLCREKYGNTIGNALRTVFRTEPGVALLKSVYVLK